MAHTDADVRRLVWSACAPAVIAPALDRVAALVPGLRARAALLEGEVSKLKASLKLAGSALKARTEERDAARAEASRLKTQADSACPVVAPGE